MDATTPQTDGENAAAPPVDDPLKALQEKFGPQLQQAQERLSETNESVKRFIRENPGTCLLGAAAVGFLIGRWASRR